MENTNEKNKKPIGAAVVIIILALLLAACLGIIVYQYVQNNNLLKKNEEKPNVTEQLTTQIETKFDPYANYKNIKWCQKESNVSDIGYIIENSKLYYVEENKKQEVKSILGTPKSVYVYPASVLNCIVLTEEGTVWKMYNIDEDHPTTKFEQITIPGNKQIIDMTSGDIGFAPFNYIYFLTYDGKLIGVNGQTFEELNQDFVNVYGVTMGVNLYISKDNTISVSNIDDNGIITYSKVKATDGKNLVVDKVFSQVISEKDNVEDISDGYRAMIITSDSKLICMESNWEKTTIKNQGNKEVASFNLKEITNEYDEEEYELTIKMKDSSTVKYTGTSSAYYDASNNKIVNLYNG